MFEIKMPKLGMAQSWCVIEKWHKKPGDEVKKGDLIVEVSTDKISYEVESQEDGFLLKILKEETTEVPVGEVIALIGSRNELMMESLQAEATKAVQKEIKPNQILEQETADEKISEKNKNFIADINFNNIKISALAKNIADAKSIDISKVIGTGPGGRILKEDVEAYIEASGKTDKEDFSRDKDYKSIRIHSSEVLSRTRKIIAKKMTYSQLNIPHISQLSKADVTKLAEIKENLSEKFQYLSFSDFFIKASAMALRDNLDINSSFSNDKHIIFEDINIGLVTVIPGGLVIPVLKNCDKKTVIEIAEKRTELNKKTIEGKLGIDDISYGTFTISNLGTYKIRSFSAIIYPPQGAIMTIGKIYLSPEVLEGKIEIRKVVELNIAEDHRIIDGAAGAKFLTKIIELLETSEVLIKDI